MTPAPIALLRIARVGRFRPRRGLAQQLGEFDEIPFSRRGSARSSRTNANGDPELPGRRFAFRERSLPIPAVQIFLMWFPHWVHVRIMRLATWLSISSLWICALCARGLKLSCAISKEDYPETSSKLGSQR